MDLNEGLDFILSHLEPPIWPREISAGMTTSKEVSDQASALNFFEYYRVDT